MFTAVLTSTYEKCSLTIRHNHERLVSVLILCGLLTLAKLTGCSHVIFMNVLFISAFFSISSPSRTTVSSLTQSAVEVEVEKFQVLEVVEAAPDTVETTSNSGAEDTETEEGFVDCQTDSEGASVQVTPDNTDSVSCDTTDTDSTGNTVVGATF